VAGHVFTDYSVRRGDPGITNPLPPQAAMLLPGGIHIPIPCLPTHTVTVPDADPSCGAGMSAVGYPPLAHGFGPQYPPTGTGGSRVQHRPRSLTQQQFHQYPQYVLYAPYHQQQQQQQHQLHQQATQSRLSKSVGQTLRSPPSNRNQRSSHLATNTPVHRGASQPASSAEAQGSGQPGLPKSASLSSSPSSPSDAMLSEGYYNASTYPPPEHTATVKDKAPLGPFQKQLDARNRHRHATALFLPSSSL